MGSLTYSINNLGLKDITSEIRRTMRRSAKDAVQLGYMLRRVLEEKLYLETYNDFDSYLEAELQMEYTMATRFMNINKKYSLNGCSMEISSQYEEYTQGALIEMLSMSPEQMQQISSDMTVRQIREIKQQNRPKKEEPEKTDQQIPGQLRLEETGEETPRTYEENDELEAMDAALIYFLVGFAITDNGITYKDFEDSDLESLFDKLCTHCEYNGTEYFLFAEAEGKAFACENPGYAEVAFEDDMQHPFIFIHNSYLVKLVMKELRDKRNMCCYGICACTYAECSRLHRIEVGRCPSNCCMYCKEKYTCGHACLHKAYSNQQNDSEKVATSQVISEQVNTGLTDDLEELENSDDEMEIITDIEATEEPEILTVPVELGDEDEEDIIDGTFREIEVDEQIQVVAAVQTDEKGNLYDADAVSAYGFTKAVYPADSLINTPGCGHKHNCFSCAQNCGIRQQDRYCVTAPMGNPYNCNTMVKLETLESEIGDICQFVDNTRAYHTVGSHEAVPCCKECLNPCIYICERAAAALKEQGGDVSEDNAEISPEEVLQNMHVRLENMLTTPDKFSPRQIERQKLIVAALASMVSELGLIEMRKELQELVQPELPELKNNDTRKAWLENYKSWGLWYRDENIDVNYYKYDFSDGSRLIVAEYPDREEYWNDKQNTQVRYHFLKKGKKKYNSKRTYDEKYRESPNSITELVEWLKQFQKNK